MGLSHEGAKALAGGLTDPGSSNLPCEIQVPVDFLCIPDQEYRDFLDE